MFQVKNFVGAAGNDDNGNDNGNRHSENIS